MKYRNHTQHPQNLHRQPVTLPGGFVTLTRAQVDLIGRARIERYFTECGDSAEAGEDNAPSPIASDGDE